MTAVDEATAAVAEIRDELEIAKTCYDECSDPDLIEAYAYKLKYLEKLIDYWIKKAKANV